ncbi:hypothetical protein CEXT_250781 [Caerostris extrusa]|uniref:Uncharacterized protein n=1 Tax=Caerostris extrusa TaxID=172846 RepID=A0AAV4PPI4_CAEEX|nr:hypothetical protein CEXT_250781 [Caerostris extrusa]
MTFKHLWYATHLFRAPKMSSANLHKFPNPEDDRNSMEKHSRHPPTSQRYAISLVKVPMVLSHSFYEFLELGSGLRV